MLYYSLMCNYCVKIFNRKGYYLVQLRTKSNKPQLPLKVKTKLIGLYYDLSTIPLHIKHLEKGHFMAEFLRG